MEDESQHRKDYRQAWEEYRTCTDPEEAKLLEKRMDDAQEKLSWDEFQEFRLTLDGFVEYWDFLTLDALREVTGGKKTNKEIKPFE